MAKVREGPLLVWYGEEPLATVIDEMGLAERHKVNQKNPVCMLFDNCTHSWVQSADSFLRKPKSLKIEFKVSPI